MLSPVAAHNARNASNSNTHRYRPSHTASTLPVLVLLPLHFHASWISSHLAAPETAALGPPYHGLPAVDSSAFTVGPLALAAKDCEQVPRRS